MRIYQNYITGDDGDYDGYTANWIAQTFTPTLVHMISKVKLKLFRVGTPGTITVSIKATAGGKPTGADLCVGTIEGTGITDDANGEWYEITLGDGYVFEKDVMYAIVVRAPSGDSDNKVSWRADKSSPTYTGGTYCSTSDSGVEWGIVSGSDCMFEEWGAGEASPTTTVWGNLFKSQISSEKIEEAVARMIQDHEDDPDAHVETGESLQSHKAAAVIDHIARSIVTDKIALLAVTVAELGNQAVETAKIKDLNVTTGKIANLAVEEAKIGSLAVTEAKIGSLAVTEGKIDSLAVTEAKIGSLAVTELKIGGLAVTAAKIATDAVETSKIKNLNVTTAKINNLAITEGKIVNLAVTDAKIANATITDAKIANLTVEKLTGTYLTGKVVRTGSGSNRVELNNSTTSLDVYFSNIKRISIKPAVIEMCSGATIHGRIYGLSVNRFALAPDEDVAEAILSKQTYSGNYACKFEGLADMIPGVDSIWDLGTNTVRWNAVYSDNYPASPIKVAKSAIEVFKKIKGIKEKDGKYTLETEDLPEEFKMKDRKGKEHTELKKTIGLAVQAISELIVEVENLKK